MVEVSSESGCANQERVSVGDEALIRVNTPHAMVGSDTIAHEVGADILEHPKVVRDSPGAEVSISQRWVTQYLHLPFPWKNNGYKFRTLAKNVV